MAPLVVLVGPPGAGKSTVGRLLARRFGVAFRETDLDVEQAAGRSIPDIFVEDGEPSFRALEQQAVDRALTEHDGVLSLGGGAILSPVTRQLLNGHRVAYLTVEIADAARRVGFNRDRPLLLKNPRAQWIALMDARRSLYEEVASVSVPTDGATAQQVVDRLVAALEVTDA